MLFYSSEHAPMHVHGLYDGQESRAELVLSNGKVTRIRFACVKGRKPLDARRMRDFRKLVRHFQDDIVRKWVEFFVLNKRFKPQTISRRLP